MDFLEAKRRFAEAVNRLSISQNDKHAILGIIEFIQPKESNNTKAIKKQDAKVKTNNTQNLIYWDNDEDYFEEIRVVTKALVCDKDIKVNDIVIDNNKVEYKVIFIDNNGKVATLKPIK